MHFFTIFNMVSKLGSKPILAKFVICSAYCVTTIEKIIVCWTYCSIRYRAAIDLPLMSSPMHEMYIPQCEGVCWKSHID